MVWINLLSVVEWDWVESLSGLSRWLAIVAVLAVGILVALLLQSSRFRRVLYASKLDEKFVTLATSILAIGSVVFAALAALEIAGHGFAWDKPIPGLGEFSLLDLVRLIALLVGTLYVASLIKRYVVHHFLVRSGLDPSLQYAVGQLTGYGLVVVGLLLIMQNAGIDFTPLTLFAGALGIGLGFGLQNLASNFISGLVILTERPLKVGDRVEMENIQGTVMEIRARSTTVRSNDNIDIIVPNSEFITKTVVNLSHNDNKVRFKLPVGVHYRSDVQLVTKALLEAAAEAPSVLKEPAPGVRFLAFGDSSLDFELRVWSEKLVDRPNALRSELNFLIWEKFHKYNIEIPYPQRDVHLHKVPEQ